MRLRHHVGPRLLLLWLCWRLSRRSRSHRNWWLPMWPPTCSCVKETIAHPTRSPSHTKRVRRRVPSHWERTDLVSHAHRTAMATVTARMVSVSATTVTRENPAGTVFARTTAPSMVSATRTANVTVSLDTVDSTALGKHAPTTAVDAASVT